MELKTRFQYTYFLHTFVINESKYAKYILKLLKEEKFKLRIFQKDKDLEIYTHFLPKIREVLFSTFELEDKNKKEKFDELPIETKAAVLAHYPSITFEYEMKKDMQGKEFFKGDGTIPWWVTSVSIFATLLSPISFLF